jgi:hypothetical protein
MKRQGISFCVGLLCAAVSAVESGDGFNTVTREVVTPHLNWAKPLAGGPLKVLFITDAGGGAKCMLAARMVVEWAQRMDLDYDVVTANAKLSAARQNPYLAVFDDNHGRAANLYEGTQSAAKEKELEEKLKKPYELYVFNNIAFPALSAEARRTILKNLVSGAGLVMIYELTTNLPNLTKYPSPELFGGISAMTALAGTVHGFEKWASKKGKLGAELEYATFVQKQGRIALIAATTEIDNGINGQNSIFYMPEWCAAFKKLKPERQAVQRNMNEAPVPLWWGDFETRCSSFLRIFHRVAGRIPAVTVSCPLLAASPVISSEVRSLEFTLNGTDLAKAELRVRLRNDENRVLREKTFAGGTGRVLFELPPLPAGHYFADAQVLLDGKVADFGVRRFAVTSPVKMTLSVKDDRIHDGNPVEVSIALSQAVPGGVFRITLSDSPYDRVWYMGEFAAGDASGQNVLLRDWYIPNSAAILRTELVKDGATLAYARRMLFRPEGNAPGAWTDLLWGGSDTPIHGLMNLGLQGWHGVTQAFSRERGNVLNHMVKGELAMPWGPLNSWYMSNQKYKCSAGYSLDPKTGETRADWNFNNGAKSWGTSQAEQDELDAFHEMARREEAVKKVMAYFERYTRIGDYGVCLVNLGDETAPGYDTYRGKYITGEFHAWLANKFGTVEKLNAEWNRSYPNFGEIPLVYSDEAKAKKLYPEGAAHRLFAEDNYFAVHRVVGSELRRINPRIYYGPNSTAYPGELETPEINASFDHPRDITSLAMRRCMRPGNLYIPLFGYAQKRAGGPNRNYWECVISGAASGHMYFSANVTFDGGTLCADFRDKQPNVTAARKLIQNGAGPLMRSLDLVSSELAVISSYPSWKAELFASEVASAVAMSSDPLFGYGNAHGYNFDYLVTTAIKGRLSPYRVLFLAGLSALAEEEAEVILEFAKAGGTVVADVNPGIFNEHLGVPAKNRLAELFGDLKPVPIGGVVSWRGMEVQGVAGIEAWGERVVGKGSAILLNFTLASLVSACGTPEKFNEEMALILKKLGMRPLVAQKGLPEGSIIRWGHGAGFDLIAFANNSLSAEGKGGGAVTVAFPQKGTIYEVLKGPVGEGDAVTVVFDPPWRFLTCFAEKQSAPVLTLSSDSPAPGKPLFIDIAGFPAKRMLYLDVRDPAGKEVIPRNESVKRGLIIPDGRKSTFPLHFAWSDPKGNYTLTLTDVATGLKTSRVVRLQ